MRTLIVAGILLLSPASAVRAEDMYVDQMHRAFSQTSLVVRSGDTVHFKNSDDVTHDIRITDPDGGISDKGIQRPGEEILHTFSKPGKYQIGCAIHKEMKLAITVK
jgi:plastocyanin